MAPAGREFGPRVASTIRKPTGTTANTTRQTTTKIRYTPIQPRDVDDCADKPGSVAAGVAVAVGFACFFGGAAVALVGIAAMRVLRSRPAPAQYARMK